MTQGYARTMHALVLVSPVHFISDHLHHPAGKRTITPLSQDICWLPRVPQHPSPNAHLFNLQPLLSPPQMHLATLSMQVKDVLQ